MKKLIPFWLVAVALAVLLTGCQQAADDATDDVSLPAADETAAEEPAAEEAATEPTVAVATLGAREGLALTGTVTFSPAENGITVLAEVSGLEGAGTHGFHVHETGDCSAADFTSAGGHFNPTGAPHAGPDSEEHHAGDLGNIEIDTDGTGRLEIDSQMLSLDPEAPGYVVGKAVILHEGQDDLESQPTGDAGGRLACAVIEIADAAGFEEEAEAMAEEVTDEVAGEMADG